MARIPDSYRTENYSDSVDDRYDGFDPADDMPEPEGQELPDPWDSGSSIWDD